MNSEAMERIRSRVQGLEAIPTIPVVIEPLLSTLQMPLEEIDIRQVQELISYDNAIAALCLRVANSPLFGRRQVETISEAIIALGLKRVQSIVLSCALTHIVPPDKWALDAITFWRHSLACALVSRKIAQLIGYQDAEKAYLSGLLHDLGILVNSLVYTEEYRRCLQHACESHMSLDKAERTDLGFTHCESGKILAEQWRIPADLAEAIECHHGLDSAQAAGDLVALVHLSDLLCRVRDLGYGYYEIMGIDFAGDAGWTLLIDKYSRLRNIDLARLSLDVEASMGEIVALVDTVFAVHP